MRKASTFIALLLTVSGVIYFKKKIENHQPTQVSEKCCVTCSDKNQVKYYSIAENDHCGECCLNPKVYWIFKIFEKNLTLAGNVACESLGYSEYVNSETHGVFPVKVTIDKYKKK